MWACRGGSVGRRGTGLERLATSTVRGEPRSPPCEPRVGAATNPSEPGRVLDAGFAGGTCRAPTFSDSSPSQRTGASHLSPGGPPDASTQARRGRHKKTTDPCVPVDTQLTHSVEHEPLGPPSMVTGPFTTAGWEHPGKVSCFHTRSTFVTRHSGGMEVGKTHVASPTDVGKAFSKTQGLS